MAKKRKQRRCEPLTDQQRKSAGRLDECLTEFVDKTEGLERYEIPVFAVVDNRVFKVTRGHGYGRAFVLTLTEEGIGLPLALDLVLQTNKS